MFFIHLQADNETSHPWTRGSEACSGGYEFSSTERRFSHFFIHLQAGYRMFQPQQRGLQHALKVTSFHPWRGRVTHFCIHPQAGYGSFQPQTRGPQTRGLRHALEVMSFHSLSDGLHIFSSIDKLVTELFNHRQEGYNMLLQLRVFIH